MQTWESAVTRVEQVLLGRRMGYTGRVRSQGREADRVVRAVLNPSCRPDAVLVPTFWWEKVKNFGDLLTPYLLRDFGIVPVLTPPAEAGLVGGGSLVQHLPAESSATLWGTGLIYDQHVELPGVQTLALRGELTRDRLGTPPVEALGDPGLLLGDTITRPGVTFDVGLVLHYVHRGDAWFDGLVDEFDGSVLLIDVAQSPAAVARQVASCRAVVSTSLHGVITADSVGVPAVWVRMPLELAGADFKFRDHESVARPATDRGVLATEVSSMRDLVARVATADEVAVDRAKTRLRAAARRIPEVAGAHRVSTWQVPLLGRGRPVHSHV
ncbi:polysaccharide pyruvyl transferase family protein [Mobilicoccus sp.]|uniref:polysaccharide pyruvyl transferase family protein n=1 Tax=Mobilicoccus sp. TaxID=2034349 RepID=UPI00289AEA6D|nr:polysaccharide pyruvyl transferase family protein [Mobilicoccus sp.]